MRHRQPVVRWIVQLAMVGLALGIIHCELLVEPDEVGLLPSTDAGAGTGVLPPTCPICTDALFFDAIPGDGEADAAPDAETGTRDTGTPDTGAHDAGPHTGPQDAAATDAG